MAIYKRGQGFERGMTENKSSKTPEWDSNLVLPDCESNTLTTRPRCLLNRDLKKTRGQSFFIDMQPEIEKDLTNMKKNFSLCSTCCSFKKNQDFLRFFQDFTSIFQTFSRSGKLLGKFQDFFKNSRLCANPIKSYSLTQINP